MPPQNIHSLIALVIPLCLLPGGLLVLCLWRGCSPSQWRPAAGGQLETDLCTVYETYVCGCAHVRVWNCWNGYGMMAVAMVTDERSL